MRLADIEMSSPLARSSIFLRSVGLLADNLTLHDVHATNQGAAIHGVDLLSIEITNSEFRNLTGLPGGALYLIQNENLKIGALSEATYKVDAVKFIDCNSKQS